MKYSIELHVNICTCGQQFFQIFHYWFWFAASLVASIKVNNVKYMGIAYPKHPLEQALSSGFAEIHRHSDRAHPHQEPYSRLGCGTR